MKFRIVLLVLAYIAQIDNSLYGTSKLTHKASYKVTRENKAIGMLHTVQTIEGSRVNYMLHSSVSISVLFKVAIHENIYSSFDSNILLKAGQTRHINGKLNCSASVNKSASGYKIMNTRKEESETQDIINKSVLWLYYNKPANGDLVYSESLNLFLKVEELNSNQYSLKLPNGNTSFFTYENGVLTKVESKTNWGTVLFERM